MKKMGCASCGGAMKKMQKGGSAEIVGMPKYGNNPRTSTGAMLKKGGVVKKLVKAQEGSIVRNTKKGRSTSNGKNFDAYENNKTGTITIARTSRNPSNSSKGVRSLYVFDDKFLKPGGNTYYKKEDVKFTKNPVNNLIKDYNTVRKSAGLPEKKYRDITTSSSQLKKEGVTQKAKGTAMKAKGQSMKADGKTLKAAAQILNKKKTGGVAKAKFGATVDVQRGYPGKIRSAEAQGYTAVGKREPARTKFAKGGFPDLNKDGKITKADILKGRGVIKRKGGAIKKK
jgi:hypothetical protein